MDHFQLKESSKSHRTFHKVKISQQPQTLKCVVQKQQLGVAHHVFSSGLVDITIILLQVRLDATADAGFEDDRARQPLGGSAQAPSVELESSVMATRGAHNRGGNARQGEGGGGEARHSSHCGAQRRSETTISPSPQACHPLHRTQYPLV